MNDKIIDKLRARILRLEAELDSVKTAARSTIADLEAQVLTLCETLHRTAKEPKK